MGHLSFCLTAAYLHEHIMMVKKLDRNEQHHSDAEEIIDFLHFPVNNSQEITVDSKKV